MAKPPRPWTVTAHRPLEKLDDNLWALDADMPGRQPFNRRMGIARLADQRLVFFNAIPMNEAALAEIRAFGTPAFLIIPHGMHKTDAHAFREKLGVKVLATAEQRKRVEAIVPVDGDLDLIPADPGVSVERVGGSKGEAMMLVKSGGGARTSLVFCDVYMQLGPNLPLLPRLLGFSSEAQIAPLMWRMMFMKDKATVRAYFDKLAALPGLTRIVPSHGRIVDQDPAGVLKRLSAKI
jgi:hypothetical protein